VAVTVTGCEFCSGGDRGSGDCGAGEVVVGAMEVVGSFKHTEVFKKMIFIFAAVGSGGCRGFGGGGQRGGQISRVDLCINFFSAVCPFLIRSEFSPFLSTEICSHLLLMTCVITRSHSNIYTQCWTHLIESMQSLLADA